MRKRTEQEEFWAGKFGNEYAQRNSGETLLASNLMFFARALAGAEPPSSCLELGANIGLNLRALKLLYPMQEQFAVEINSAAVEELRRSLPSANVRHTSIIGVAFRRTFDLVLVKGVLIHVAPADLEKVYRTIYKASARYILICEYYNPTPVEVAYRGFREKLFKRDFCGELLDLYPDLQLRDYGFAYRRDKRSPQDDITWFLLEKQR